MLAGTIAVSGVVLLNGDVSVAADTTGVTTVTTAATSNYQNGTYTATAALYKSGTAVSSMMSSMVNSQADVTIKNQTATITLTFGELSNANMVKSWAIDGVEATQSGQTFTVAIPVVDLSKTLQSTIHIETMIGSVPFSETQPVDLTVTDLKLVARDPDEVAAEQAAADKAAAEKAADKVAADKAAAEKAAADKAAADKAAAEKAAADKAAADKAAADKAAADKAAADKDVADKAAADKAAADKAAAEKAKQAAKAKVEQKATKNSQNGTYTATAKLYKSGTTDDSMMASMVSPTAYIVIKDGQATITLTFKDMATINMVKTWVIDGVSAVKNGQSVVIVLPTSELGKTLKSTIHVETMLGTLPFTETQPVDLKLGNLERIPSGSMSDNPSNPSNLPNNYVSPNQATGHDVPLTAQLSSTSKLPNTAATNTATNETTTALLLAALVSGVLALGIWLKKFLR